MGFCLTDLSSIAPRATEEPHRKLRKQVGKPRPERRDPPSKNRVWDFQNTSRFRAPRFPSQPLETTSETSVTLTIIVSGLPLWPSRDPIGEWGGVNQYVAALNALVNKVDFLGEKTSSGGLSAISPSPPSWKTVVKCAIDAFGDDFWAYLKGVNEWGANIKACTQDIPLFCGNFSINNNGVPPPQKCCFKGTSKSLVGGKKLKTFLLCMIKESAGPVLGVLVPGSLGSLGLIGVSPRNNT